MQKANQILSHPAIQILCFLGLLISGESFGGFYYTYLRHAVAEGFLYAIIGWLAVALTLASLIVPKLLTLQSILQFAGLSGMVISLGIFFLQPGGGYNNGTFLQLVPLATFIVFIVVSVSVMKKTSEHLRILFLSEEV